MKSIATQLSYFLQDTETRRNVGLLMRYLVYMAGIVVLFTVLFHLIMVHVEGERYSWITGLYWTLTVMSTLGFGDITFQTDVGRLFSIVVLLSGIVLLLIVLPFAFIRFFYAPWLEAQIRQRAPRALAPETAGHVVLCQHDALVPDLIPGSSVRTSPTCCSSPTRSGRRICTATACRWSSAAPPTRLPTQRCGPGRRASS